MWEGVKAKWEYHPKLNLQLDPKSQEGLVVVVKLQDLSFFGVESPGSNEAGGVLRGCIIAMGYSQETLVELSFSTKRKGKPQLR